MDLRKLGVIGIVAALLLAFGAFGLSNQTAKADVTGVTAGDATNGVATVTVAVDASGAVLIQTNNGTLDFVGCTAATDCDSTPVSGDGSSAVTVTADVATTITMTENCSAAGTYTVTAQQGTSSMFDTGNCDSVAFGVIDSFNAAVEVDPGTLETNPVGISTNCADIIVEVAAEDANGNRVVGEDVKVLVLSGTGRLTEVTIGPGDSPCDELDPDSPDTSATRTQRETEITTTADGDPGTSGAQPDLVGFAYVAVTGSTLGPDTLQIIVHNGADSEIFSESVTIVGPPASLTIDASPTELICGEKATIVGTVQDAIGQNVSNGTAVELITNFGGVAVSGGTSGIGFGGKATTDTTSGAFSGFLLTSTTHVGPYEVVASVNSIFAQTTVTCSMPAPTPDIVAPDTGTGTISPPNTGDAGLAAASTSSNASLFVIAGAVAFALAGLAVRFGFARN